MSNTVIAWILLFAAAQGAFLSVVLLSMGKGRKGVSHKLMATLLAVFVIIILDAWASLTGWYWRVPHLLHASIAFPLLVGPLIYLHLRWTLWQSAIVRYAGWHYLPFLVGLILWLPYYSLSAKEKLLILESTHEIPWYISVFAMLKIAHLLCYIVFSFRMLNEARRIRPDDKLAANLSRFGNFLVLGIGVVLVLFAIEHLGVLPPISSDTLSAMVLTIFVYGLAVSAIRLPNDYQAQTPTSKPRYDGNQLSDAQRQEFLSKLLLKIEHDQIYRHGDLKLETLAEVLAMTPHELSQLINLEYATNFSDFLNRYRVEALKQALCDPARQEDTILELAIHCGFNSKSALNRAFKKITGMTPTEFRRCHSGGAVS